MSVWELPQNQKMAIVRLFENGAVRFYRMSSPRWEVGCPVGKPPIWADVFDLETQGLIEIAREDGTELAKLSSIGLEYAQALKDVNYG